MTQEKQKSPEVSKSPSAVVYEAIVGINAERNPVFTALDQIKGKELAVLFLKGYADTLAKDAPELFSDHKTTPLDLAASNIRYVAGYHVTGDNGSEQLKAILKPWASAYEELIEKS
jgi:hypothetical protein